MAKLANNAKAATSRLATNGEFQATPCRRRGASRCDKLAAKPTKPTARLKTPSPRHAGCVGPQQSCEELDDKATDGELRKNEHHDQRHVAWAGLQPFLVGQAETAGV